MKELGVLITNLGTPEAPTAKAVRRYLAEFLWDPRVVELPRPLWWLILHGIVLRFRPRKSAENYQRVWTPQGSPLLSISSDLVSKLQQNDAKIVLGMRYGHPSIAEALEKLRGVEKLIILPLYPQYSGATTGSTFDGIARVLQTWRQVPELSFISNYHDNRYYIEAIASSIREHWQAKGRAEKLLFSFHGLPQRNIERGDPYQAQCLKTANLVAQALDLPESAWQVVFQSRFGAAKWLQPYCDKTLEVLPTQGIKSVDIICPGFAVDCLETLDEIARENEEIFIKAGGQRFEYIPALNSSAAQINLMTELIKTYR